MATITYGSYPVSTKESDTPTGLAQAVRQTRWHFAMLLFFFAAQAFTIPVLPIGPKWAIWPGFADFAMMAMFPVVFFLGVPQGIMSKPNRTLSKWLFVIYCLSIHSFLLFRLVRAINGQGLTDDDGFTIGIYQIYRFTQFFFLFWVTAHIPLTEYRRNLIIYTLVGVLIVIALGIFVTYTNAVQPIVFVQHLSADGDKLVTGPWNIYWTHTRLNISSPFGTVSYNHAYTGLQVLLLLGFYFHLRGNRQSIYDVMLIALANFTVLISGSRAGLLALMVFSGIFMMLRPRYLYGGILAVMIMLLLSLLGIISNPLEKLISEDTQESTATLLDATNADNLSGRDLIWGERLDYLNQDITRWLFGVGFGSAYNSGNNAHNQPLQIILETGLFGLSIFLMLVVWVVRQLWKYDRYVKPIFWCTVALLVSSMTQENFYPVPAMLYFIGFYLSVVAITLNPHPEELAESDSDPQAALAHSA